MLSLRVVVRKGGILGVSGAFGSEALRTDNDTSKNKHCRQALLATPPIMQSSVAGKHWHYVGKLFV